MWQPNVACKQSNIKPQRYKAIVTIDRQTKTTNNKQRKKAVRHKTASSLVESSAACLAYGVFGCFVWCVLVCRVYGMKPATRQTQRHSDTSK